MAIIDHELRLVDDRSTTGLMRRLFSSLDYHKMGESGLFDGQKVELIEGEVVTMSPIGDPQAALTEPIGELLKGAFGTGCSVRCQAPIALGRPERPSEPEPNVAVVEGGWRKYLAKKPQPRDIRLIVEIADSSLDYDRKVKAALYAEAGIPEYWIVNLNDNRVEVHRDPSEGVYWSVTTATAEDRLFPAGAMSDIAVCDILP